MNVVRRRARRSRTRQRLLWLSRSPRNARLRRCIDPISLQQLEDSRRPLLFSLLPRMVHRDGRTPESLQSAFGYIEQGRDRAPAIIVSSHRWTRALATARTLANGRAARRRDP